MRRRLRTWIPSPAMAVACLALAISLSGIGYAAITIPRNSVGTPQLKKNAVISSKVKNGSLRAADFGAGQLPAGPEGPAGPAKLIAPPAANGAQTVDSTGDVGQYASIAIGGDGLGLVSYYDVTNGDLRVAHCGNVICSSATTHTIDSADDVGKYSSLTIAKDGLGIISYYDLTNSHLKVAHCDNAACSTATTHTFDAATNAGRFTSAAIGGEGRPLISYADDGIGTLRMANCEQDNCDLSAFARTVDPASGTNTTNSISLGVDGQPLIAYYDSTNFDLKVVHCLTLACNTDPQREITTVDSTDDVGVTPSLTIAPNGLPLIAYYDATHVGINVALCTNVGCTSSTVQPNPNIPDAYAPSLTIGPDGLPLIAYTRNSGGTLGVAHCVDLACTDFTAVQADTGPVSRLPSLTVGTDGLPLIAHYDIGNGDLRIVHCANIFCAPYLRPR